MVSQKVDLQKKSHMFHKAQLLPWHQNLALTVGNSKMTMAKLTGKPSGFPWKIADQIFIQYVTWIFYWIFYCFNTHNWPIISWCCGFNPQNFRISISISPRDSGGHHEKCILNSLGFQWTCGPGPKRALLWLGIKQLEEISRWKKNENVAYKERRCKNPSSHKRNLSTHKSR